MCFKIEPHYSSFHLLMVIKLLLNEHPWFPSIPFKVFVHINDDGVPYAMFMEQLKKHDAFHILYIYASDGSNQDLHNYGANHQETMM